MAKFARQLAKPSLYSYLAPRLGLVILVLFVLQYLSAFFFAQIGFNAPVPGWVSWYVVQTVHFWVGIALSVVVGMKAGTALGKLLRRDAWEPGPGAGWSWFNSLVSIGLVLCFATLFVTGLGMSFRLYYLWGEIPIVQLRWLETHYWAFTLVPPLFVLHLLRYFKPAWRVAWPAGARPTGGTPPLAGRRTLLGLTIGGAAALTFALNFWPLGRLRFLAGPAIEDGYPVETVLGMSGPIDPAAWRLAVTGDVARPLALRYEEILRLPMETHEIRLSCVTGWTTVQRWTGVLLRTVLEQAGAAADWQHVDFRGASGYHWAWWRDDLTPQALLVVSVDGKPISHNHGFPLRLIAPNRPGQNNVKQLVELVVSREPAPPKGGDLRIFAGS
ncbi:MAG: molybdopterin-dependent oxidoreductase [Dehalococcoidia bacterium]